MSLTLRHAYFASVLALLGSGADALSLPDCDRVTHAFHGGETAHVDLGQGRVMWQGWWSQEATIIWLHVVDCASGETLMARTAASNLDDRPPYDRTDRALAVIERHESGARVFATFERIAADLERLADNIRITRITDEPCACAALYPDARGDKTAFTLGG